MSVFERILNDISFRFVCVCVCIWIVLLVKKTNFYKNVMLGIPKRTLVFVGIGTVAPHNTSYVIMKPAVFVPGDGVRAVALSVSIYFACLFILAWLSSLSPTPHQAPIRRPKLGRYEITVSPK